jgi:hypothetical protein
MMHVCDLQVLARSRIVRLNLISGDACIVVRLFSCNLELVLGGSTGPNLLKVDRYEQVAR